MQLQEAKQLIASYLTGRHVPHEKLKTACEVAKSDAEYIRYLEEELGYHGNWVTECDVFLSSLAEFSEMSQEEREREMPLALVHLTQCPSCRMAYWEAMPMWQVSSDERGKGATSRLSEAIRLRTDATGMLRDIGLGPLPEQPSPVVAAAAGAPASETDSTVEFAEPGIKQWVLPEDKARFTIHLEVRAQNATEIHLSCRLETTERSTVSPQDIRVQVWSVGGRSPQFAGPLSDFEEGPVVLPLGSWVVRLVSDEPTGGRTWEIPLELAQEKPGEDAAE